jgi:hypothetical protein
VKSKILILFPYPFTEFNYYKFEISKIKQKYKNQVVIHDLSQVVISKKFNKEWKTKIEKKTKKFYSLYTWIKNFLSKKNEKFIIINFIKTINLNSFLINIFVKLSKNTVLVYHPVDLFSSIKPYKKSLNFFLSRVMQHKFNLKVYIFSIQKIIFNFLLRITKGGKKIILSNNFDRLVLDNIEDVNKDQIININFNSYDYSNCLTYKIKKKLKKKYILYIDNGAPYFAGDAYLKGEPSYLGDIKKQYNDLNNFFDKIEKIFSAKIIVIPHPKYKSYSSKIKSLNPYFKHRVVNNNYDALAQLSKNCLFFINKHSTAISYPIFFKKPVIHIYSTQYNYQREEWQSLFDLAKSIGRKPIDIMNFKKKEILSSLKINKKKYEEFKYNYLTPKKKNLDDTPNYKILNNLFKMHE